MSQSIQQRTRAQESRAAIQQLYISMRHLFIRGGYKPLGVSGEAMREALMVLRPEIYGSITDPERVELEGLLYIFQRLPQGIEECRYIRLITKEGFEGSEFDPIVPAKRRRNCYRIDQEQMFIEMTNGRSDIYDILTHLTFLYVEAEKIRRNSLDVKGRKKRDWLNLEKIIELETQGESFDEEVASTYLSNILGRTFSETLDAVRNFEAASKVNSLFHIAYWMGRLSIEEELEQVDREINFSAALREKIGHHVYGELWAIRIKSFLHKKNWLGRPIHIISSNPHSVMNCLYSFAALADMREGQDLEDLAKELSHASRREWRQAVEEYAANHGMYQLDDKSGTNIAVQLFDTTQIVPASLPPEIKWDNNYIQGQKPIILVMDYAFGEQAYEVMDELLKPFEFLENGDADPKSKVRIPLRVASISIMGKAGILEGGKGDIMVPTAHVFEGTADNYPVKNDFTKADFEGNGLRVCEGPMITVLGTSLQNKDILRYFLKSSWKAIGLEMEGAHYQKAIQAASKIRKSINEDVVLRYAYYASDNPLITGHTLASGSLGEEGVKPTYLITMKMLNRIGDGLTAGAGR
ncbi:MAG: hypothetical protein H6577_04495 [Lewinellaceae bacterium]|nr:hypothetical protein [Saprospiraceae bacterium]MCB9337361.1 hypothetical protein [Lewinellaceae bacterium]